MTRNYTIVLHNYQKVKESSKVTAIFKDNDRVFMKQTTSILNPFLINDLSEKSFGMQINKNGSSSLHVIDNEKFVTIIHHVGDLETLLAYANYKKTHKISSSPDRIEKRNASELSRQYIYMKNKTCSDNPESRLITLNSKNKIDDVRFIKDYMYFLQFCFDWLGKPLPKEVQVNSDIFSVSLCQVIPCFEEEKLDYSYLGC